LGSQYEARDLLHRRVISHDAPARWTRRFFCPLRPWRQGSNPIIPRLFAIILPEPKLYLRLSLLRIPCGEVVLMVNITVSLDRSQHVADCIKPRRFAGGWIAHDIEPEDRRLFPAWPGRAPARVTYQNTSAGYQGCGDIIRRTAFSFRLLDNPSSPINPEHLQGQLGRGERCVRQDRLVSRRPVLCRRPRSARK
jgi:hypothetical protein